MEKEKSRNKGNGKDKYWELIEIDDGEIIVKVDDKNEIVTLIFTDEDLAEIKKIKEDLHYPYSQVAYAH